VSAGVTANNSTGKSAGGPGMAPPALTPEQRQQIDAQSKFFGSGLIGGMSGPGDQFAGAAPKPQAMTQPAAGQSLSPQDVYNNYAGAIFGTPSANFSPTFAPGTPSTAQPQPGTPAAAQPNAFDYAPVIGQMQQYVQSMQKLFESLPR